MTKPRVYGLLGDGGYALSPGFNSFLDRLAAAGYDVLKREDSGRDTNFLVKDALSQPADRHIAAVGYSLGGNGTAWFADAMWKVRPSRKIAMIAAIDATRNGPSLRNYPIRGNVGRVVCIRQTLPWSPTNWFAGGGQLVAAEGGPLINYVDTWADHLYVQHVKQYQDYILSMLDFVTKG